MKYLDWRNIIERKNTPFMGKYASPKVKIYDKYYRGHVDIFTCECKSFYMNLFNSISGSCHVKLKKNKNSSDKLWIKLCLNECEFCDGIWISGNSLAIYFWVLLHIKFNLSRINYI